MRTLLKFALSLTYLLFESSDQTTNPNEKYVHQQSVFHRPNVTDNLTLKCSYGDPTLMLYWYKQPLGQKPRHISTLLKAFNIVKLFNEFNNSRFTLDTETGANHLTISDLHISDSATYYCVGCDPNRCEFGEGATVSVIGSGLIIQSLIHRSASESIQPEASETLNCTVHTGSCDGEHSVYWFKKSEESSSALIYTEGDRNDQCERKPDTQTHNCVYNLLMENQSLSHPENVCAVTSCGHMLFGNKKNPDVEYDSGVSVYFLSGALAFTTILAVLLMYVIYIMDNRNSCQGTDNQERPSVSSTPNAEGDRDSENLHYAALTKQVNRSTRQRDNTQGECVYSIVCN